MSSHLRQRNIPYLAAAGQRHHRRRFLCSKRGEHGHRGEALRPCDHQHELRECDCAHHRLGAVFRQWCMGDRCRTLPTSWLIGDVGADGPDIARNDLHVLKLVGLWSWQQLRLRFSGGSTASHLSPLPSCNKHLRQHSRISLRDTSSVSPSSTRAFLPPSVPERCRDDAKALYQARNMAPTSRALPPIQHK